MSFRLSLLVAFMLAAAVPAVAQTRATAAPRVTAPADTAVISGLVRDSSGAAIPGASVRIVNEVTGTAADVTSNERGAFQTGPLKVGQY